MSDEADGRQAQYLFVTPQENNQVAVVERVDPDRLPHYQVLAHTQCLWCSEWCWLGDKSLALIGSGQAVPICMQCAPDVIPEDSMPLGVIVDSPQDPPDFG